MYLSAIGQNAAETDIAGLGEVHFLDLAHVLHGRSKAQKIS